MIISRKKEKREKVVTWFDGWKVQKEGVSWMF